jgi:hypothetical protein
VHRFWLSTTVLFLVVEGLVQVALDGWGRAAAARAEVDEGVAVEVWGEVGAEEVGDELGWGGGFEEGDLGVCEYGVLCEVLW